MISFLVDVTQDAASVKQGKTGEMLPEFQPVGCSLVVVKVLEIIKRALPDLPG